MKPFLLSLLIACPLAAHAVAIGDFALYTFTGTDGTVRNDAWEITGTFTQSDGSRSVFGDFVEGGSSIDTSAGGPNFLMSADQINRLMHSADSEANCFSEGVAQAKSATLETLPVLNQSMRACHVGDTWYGNVPFGGIKWSTSGCTAENADNCGKNGTSTLTAFHFGPSFGPQP
jgi:hypothetical protein